MAKVGYSFWGYLGDTKYNSNAERVSTPDGNAFYSWSIINSLIKRGYEVIQIMPDRDAIGYNIYNSFLFSSWGRIKRDNAYNNTIKIDYSGIDKDDFMKSVFNIWDNIKLNECDFILHEWRMLIFGRNDDITLPDWQPDYYLQECLVRYCKLNKIKLIIFDLDYKLGLTDIDFGVLDNCDFTIIELGYKWKFIKEVKSIRVDIPFDFSIIDELSINEEPQNNLVYVGNRYERDWCIDKYIPTKIKGVSIYGNWLESNRDSKERWPNINFGKRIDVQDMYKIYSNSVATILLAKEEYCKFGFMTARIIESIFYGTVPLFIEEFDKCVIKRYAGKYAEFLTVNGRYDVIDAIYSLSNSKEGLQLRRRIINYLRNHLEFMDSDRFVESIENII